MRVYACRGMMEVSRWSNERSACGSALCCCRCCCCCCCCCATIGPRSICTCGFVPRLASISRGHRPHDLVGLAILSIIWQSAASSTPRLPLLTASPRAKRLASPPLASIISVAITPTGVRSRLLLCRREHFFHHYSLALDPMIRAIEFFSILTLWWWKKREKERKGEEKKWWEEEGDRCARDILSFLLNKQARRVLWQTADHFLRLFNEMFGARSCKFAPIPTPFFPRNPTASPSFDRWFEINQAAIPLPAPPSPPSK